MLFSYPTTGSEIVKAFEECTGKPCGEELHGMYDAVAELINEAYEEGQAQGRAACSMSLQELPETVKADFCCVAADDSMMNHGICCGDYVFCDADATPANGDICAVAVAGVSGEALLRHVYRQDGSIVLLADNYKYPSMCYTGDEIERVKILGVAVCVNHRLNKAEPA